MSVTEDDWASLLAMAGDKPVLSQSKTAPLQSVKASVHGREPFLHYCDCGKWGSFGFGVDHLNGKDGRWFCREHRP